MLLLLVLFAATALVGATSTASSGCGAD